MDQDIRIIFSDFNGEASRIVFTLFSEFREEADKIERVSNENVFHMLKAKYISTLKHRLEHRASLLIEQCNTADSQGRLRIGFAGQISYYLKEFMMKSGTL